MAKLKTSSKALKQFVRLTTPAKKAVLRPAVEQVDTPLDLLAKAVEEVRAGKRTSVRTSKLVAAGVPKMAQKVVEEAAEVAIEAVRGQRKALIEESVDLVYNLVVLLVASGVSLQNLYDEMNRRAMTLGMAEKLPKIGDDF